MLLAILVFLAVSGAVVGAYYAFVHRPEHKVEREFEQRLKDLSNFESEDGPATSVVLSEARSSALPVVDRLVGGTGAGSWLANLIEQSGVAINPGTVITMSLGACAGLGLLTLLFSRLWLAAFVAALVGLAAPVMWLKVKRGSRLRKFEEQFPEALDLLSRAIRAGHAFQSAMGMVADELPAPVGIEFKKSFEQQNFGLPLQEALDNLTVRVPLMDVKFFVTAVQIQRETGGNLAEILDNLANVVRERFKILRQVRVHTAHGRFTGYVLLGLPAFLAVALMFISPDHMRTLFTVRMGQMMVMGAIVMQTIGFIWIRQVIKIEV
ncbi:MAG TPA: type II secretion system F family protein [Vicinamibacterales bacterium]|nr:type II secretion system F family protein [Vicinamibacterales bacterium]